MSTVERRCPVTWRYILGLISRLDQPGYHLLYADELSSLEEMKRECALVGRSHSVQLLRGFFLLEAVLMRAGAVVRAYPGYEWKVTELISTQLPPRSREGLTAILEAIESQKDSLEIDAAESRLSGDVKVFENTEVAKQAVTSINSKKLTSYFGALQQMTRTIRSNLVESDNTLGSIAIDAHKAMDAVESAYPARTHIARTLLQITKENPLSPWQ